MKTLKNSTKLISGLLITFSFLCFFNLNVNSQTENEKVVSVFVESLLPANILNGSSQQIKSAGKKLLIEDVMFIGYQCRVIRNDSVIFSFFQK